MARKETEEWDSLRTSVEELVKLSDDISFIGLKKMVKIYTFDKLEVEENEETSSDKQKEPFFITDFLNMMTSTITGIIGGIFIYIYLDNPISDVYPIPVLIISSIIILLICLLLMTHLRRK